MLRWSAIISVNPATPINGNIYCSILILNHSKYTNHGVRVVPILAPSTTPSPLYIPMIPAPTNPSVIIVTIELL